MRIYRTDGRTMRTEIAAERDPGRRQHYQAQYNWLKNNWFNVVEFYLDPTRREARLATKGLICLPDLCQ